MSSTLCWVLIQSIRWKHVHIYISAHFRKISHWKNGASIISWNMSYVKITQITAHSYKIINWKWSTTSICRQENTWSSQNLYLVWAQKEESDLCIYTDKDFLQDLGLGVEVKMKEDWFYIWWKTSVLLWPCMVRFNKSIIVLKGNSPTGSQISYDSQQWSYVPVPVPVKFSKLQRFTCVYQATSWDVVRI